MADVSTKRYCRIVVETLDSQLSKLSGAVKGSLENLSEKMFEKGLITDPIHNNPESFNKVIDHFKSHICLLENKPRNDVETKVELFLNILEESGGPLKTAEEIIRNTIEKAMQDEQRRLQVCALQQKSTSSPQVMTLRDMESHVLPDHPNLPPVPANMFNSSNIGSKHPLTETCNSSVTTAGVESYDVKPMNEANSSTTSLVVTRKETSNEQSSIIPTSAGFKSSNDAKNKVPPSSRQEIENTSSRLHLQPSQTGNRSPACHSVHGHNQQTTLSAYYSVSEIKNLLDEKDKRICELENKFKKIENERESKIEQDQEKLKKDKEGLEEREKRQDKEFEDRKRRLEKDFEERKNILEKDFEEREKKLEKDKQKWKSTRSKEEKNFERSISADKKRLHREISSDRKTMENEMTTRKHSLQDDESAWLDKKTKLTSWESRLHDNEMKLNQDKERIFQKENELKEEERLQSKRRLDDKEAIRKEEKRINKSSQEIKTKWEHYWAEDEHLRERQKEIETRAERFEATKQNERFEATKQNKKKLDIKTYLMLAIIVFLILFAYS